MIRRPPSSTLFPSTPLSRSPQGRVGDGAPAEVGRADAGDLLVGRGADRPPAAAGRRDPPPRLRPPLHGRLGAGARSEEHTSELQSRQYLVCRLLLEKKK